MYHNPDGEIDWSWDNTGLNTICLICKNWELKCSMQGSWGEWYTPFGETPDEKFHTVVNAKQMMNPKINPPQTGAPICEKGLQAAYLEAQEYQGAGAADNAFNKNDDMGLYYFGMYCGQDEEMLRPIGLTPMSGDQLGKKKVPGMLAFGKDSDPSWDCGVGNAICGIQTMNYNPIRRKDVGSHSRSPNLENVEAPGIHHNSSSRQQKIFYDDVGLSGVNFKCCKIPA